MYTIDNCLPPSPGSQTNPGLLAPGDNFRIIAKGFILPSIDDAKKRILQLIESDRDYPLTRREMFEYYLLTVFVKNPSAVENNPTLIELFHNRDNFTLERHRELSNVYQLISETAMAILNTGGHKRDYG